MDHDVDIIVVDLNGDVAVVVVVTVVFLLFRLLVMKCSMLCGSCRAPL